MTWPTVAVSTANADAGTKSPKLFRVDLMDFIAKVNQMIAHASTVGKNVLGAVDAAAARSAIGAFSTAGGTMSGDLRVDASIGIGTAPSNKVHVYSGPSAYMQVQTINAGSGAGFVFQNATSKWLIGAGPASGASEFAIVDQTGASLERMRINSSGNMGINGDPGSNCRLFAKGVDATAANWVVQFANSTGGLALGARNDGAVHAGLLASSPYNLTTNLPPNAVLQSDGYIYRCNSIGGAVRHWLRFVGTGTVSVTQQSGGLALTDLGTGYYRITLPVGAPHGNYAVMISGNADSGVTITVGGIVAITATYVDIRVGSVGTGASIPSDRPDVWVSFIW